jgi:hypothetical protein
VEKPNSRCHFLSLLALFIATLNVPSAGARDKFPRPTLSEMVDACQAAATGKIIEVKTGSYVLKVDKMLRGQRAEQLEIQFSRYACMPRPFEYQVNQQFDRVARPGCPGALAGGAWRA